MNHSAIHANVEQHIVNFNDLHHSLERFGRVIMMRASRDIDEGEELCWDYGADYQFPGPDGQKACPCTRCLGEHGESLARPSESIVFSFQGSASARSATVSPSTARTSWTPTPTCCKKTYSQTAWATACNIPLPRTSCLRDSCRRFSECARDPT